MTAWFEAKPKCKNINAEAAVRIVGSSHTAIHKERIFYTLPLAKRFRVMELSEVQCISECPHRDTNSGNCPFPGDDGLPVQCVGEWAEDKYWFLGRYVEATRHARKKFWQNGNAVYVDLYCGPGRCRVRPTKKEVDNGAMKVMAHREVPFNEYHFVDAAPESVDALKQRASSRNSYYRADDSTKIIHELVAQLDYDIHHVKRTGDSDVRVVRFDHFLDEPFSRKKSWDYLLLPN